MALSMNVTFQGELAEKIQRLATLRHQDVTTLVEALVDQALPKQNAMGEPSISDIQAYLTLHPMLKKKYLGQYIAIFRGKLVDHDRDYEALYQRIEVQYPNNFVWIGPVEEKAIPTTLFHLHYAQDIVPKNRMVPRPGSITESLWGSLGQANPEELAEIFSYDYEDELSKR